jgi:hypothetical protein
MREGASFAQDQHITELEERDQAATTKNYEIAVKKRQEADSDAQRYSWKLRKKEDVDRLRNKYDDAKNE